ncbi:MAG: carbohydrate ABC transporter permease [Planctomycetota bacterium]|jgi:multiple sugar transport system permease protein
MPAKKRNLAEELRSTRHTWVFHVPLLLGAALFLLPLVWMLSISVKPLEQTMDPSFDPFPRGYFVRADSSGTHVYLGEVGSGGFARIVRVEWPEGAEKDTPVKDHAMLGAIVAPPLEGETVELEDGNIAHLEILPRLPIYRERLLTESGYLVKTKSGKSPGVVNWVRKDDLKGRVARLADGQQVDVDMLRELEATEEKPFWLVRERKAQDADTKVVSAVQGDAERYVGVVPAAEVVRAIRPQWNNYPTGLRRMNFWRALFNTLLVCIMGVVGVTASSVLVAYGLSFIEFRGRRALFLLTLATMMIPFPATMVPLFAVFRWLGWVGTFKPLWVPAWFGSAFFIFLLRQFFKGIPKDLLDSARLAGASELQILWHVVLPLSRPALAMVALFHFLYCWKDFMGPLLYLNDKARHTLSLALQHFHAEQGGTPWHLMMAASAVFSLPLIVLFFFTVKTFIRSITMTGLKG